MNELSNSIDVYELKAAMSESRQPLLLDVRRQEIFEAALQMIEGAIWCDHEEVADFVGTRMEQGREVIVYCVHGHEISQGAQALLARHGFQARYLEGGFEAWEEAGLPLAHRT